MSNKKPDCKFRGCKRRDVMAGYCASHAKKVADKKFSLLIREPGFCLMEGFRFPCKGYLQAAHLVSRYYKATRWDEDNAVCLCMSHHRWLDGNPLEKRKLAIEWLGEQEFRDLEYKGMAGNGNPKAWRPELEKFLLAQE